jgi:uracil-DNA glycosylase
MTLSLPTRCSAYPARKRSGHPVGMVQRRNCGEFLGGLFDIVRPRVVIAFGNQALRALHRFYPIQVDGSPPNATANSLKVGDLVARPIAPWAGTTLLPLFHPGPIVRANAHRKDRRRATGRSDEQQLSDFEVVGSLLLSST